ncbi:hypothetical protein DPX39_050027800 [Trypanosoma brucei equiperdum]|uniref:Endonuclease-reverse transcriptase/Reverse transcriptase (RNA-dependent DNA polymerase) n=1 Tax=Trypanosoma brucei equiperdum TaxID=630700 RepID=A0A3L6L8S3_9TRYP|nr:hypothetical protein DPX39_050027800 [Trypanosoma brucei equiperdum]
MYAWLKADWRNFRLKVDEICRKIGREKNINTLEQKLSSAIRIATKVSVPRGCRATPPHWTPELAKLDEEIAGCGPSYRREKLVATRKQILDRTTKKRWSTLCSRLAVSDRCSWHIVKKVYAPRPLTTPAVLVDCAAITDYRQAERFSKLYSSRARRHPDSHPPAPIKTIANEFSPITMAELRRSIKLLPSGSAAGPDCLYNEALQHLGRTALNVVLRLFNESLRTGVMPPAWKTGVIIPILKAGRRRRTSILTRL